MISKYRFINIDFQISISKYGFLDVDFEMPGGKAGEGLGHPWLLLRTPPRLDNPGIRDWWATRKFVVSGENAARDNHQRHQPVV